MAMTLSKLPRSRFVSFGALGALTAIGLVVGPLGCSSKSGAPTDIGGARYADLETTPSTPATESRTLRESHAIKTVFVITMENHDWSEIKGNASAPYINGTLLAEGAHAERYFSPNDVHPSEPNYIWLEAGDNLSIWDDDGPHANYRTTRVHLTSQLDTADVPWKSYQEGISGTECPLDARGRYAPKHNPMVFFDDQTDARKASSATCIAHQRPYEELESDLRTNNVAAYNFITPDMCNDMHDSAGCVTGNSIKNGDAWLAREVPKILASKAYQDGGAIFIVWDENEGAGHGSIGMIALSPFAKKGYAGQVSYTHSSLLRTMQDVFAVKPYIRDAETAMALDDLFVSYP
jgi:hypothetical protein